MKSSRLSRLVAAVRDRLGRLRRLRRGTGGEASAPGRNPRTDAQRILARHELLRLLFGAEFDELMREELEFCAEAGRTVRWYAQRQRRDAAAAIAHWERTYEQTWAGTLAGRTPADRPTVLVVAEEAAPERAADDPDPYALAAYGLAPLLRLTRLPPTELPATTTGRYDVVLITAEGVPPELDRAAALARHRLVVNLTDLPDEEVEPLTRRLPGRVTARHLRSLLRDEYGFGYWPAERAWTMVAEPER